MTTWCSRGPRVVLCAYYLSVCSMHCYDTQWWPSVCSISHHFNLSDWVFNGWSEGSLRNSRRHQRMRLHVGLRIHQGNAANETYCVEEEVLEVQPFAHLSFKTSNFHYAVRGRKVGDRGNESVERNRVADRPKNVLRTSRSQWGSEDQRWSKWVPRPCLIIWSFRFWPLDYYLIISLLLTKTLALFK